MPDLHEDIYIDTVLTISCFMEEKVVSHLGQYAIVLEKVPFVLCKAYLLPGPVIDCIHSSAGFE